MLIRVCLLLLIVGVYASYADINVESTTEDELFGQLDVFPENFLTKYPNESEFFTLKILVYLFFNIFAKYLGANEPLKFWTKFNHNNFNRVAIDAVFYEYLTKFADRKTKHLIFNPLESSTTTPEDIAIDRIGDYLDNLSAVDQSNSFQETEIKDNVNYNAKSSAKIPTFGIPGKDFPNYGDIPKTSFSCADKLVPGIYADTETNCQVFHICWPRRIDSHLCPVGTTFNQALLTCDFWHESDCSSSPLLFDHSQFEKIKIPKDTETTLGMDDETRFTSETIAHGLDIPEYDGTCQSLVSKPLQLHMKFLPEKCKVTYLKTVLPGTTEKHFNRQMVDILSRNFGEMFAFMMRGAELGSRMPEIKELITPKLDSKFEKIAPESTLKNDDVEATVEEQIYPLTTKLPFDNQDKFPSGMDSGFVEKSVFKVTSQGKLKHSRTVNKSTLLKPSKPSEDTIKQAFDTMITSLELGSRMLNKGILPLVERIVLDNRRKKSTYNS